MTGEAIRKALHELLYNRGHLAPAYLDALEQTLLGEKGILPEHIDATRDREATYPYMELVTYPYPPLGDEVCDPREVYVLKDVNTNFYSCGHYPEWAVLTCTATGIREDGYMWLLDGDGKTVACDGWWRNDIFTTREEADRVAEQRNAVSRNRWRHYLNG